MSGLTTPTPMPVGEILTEDNCEGQRGKMRRSSPTGIPSRRSKMAHYSKAVARAILRARSKISWRRDSKCRNWGALMPVRVIGRKKTPVGAIFEATTEVNLSQEGQSAPSSPDSVVVLHIGPSKAESSKSPDYEDISEVDSADEEEMEPLDVEIIPSSRPSSPIPQGDHLEPEVDLEEEHNQAILLQEAIQAKRRELDEKLTEKESQRKIGIAQCSLPVQIGPAPSNGLPPQGTFMKFPASGNSTNRSVAAIVSSAVLPLVQKLIPARSCCPTAHLSHGTVVRCPQAQQIRVELLLPQNQQLQNFPPVSYDPSLIDLVEMCGAKAMEGHFQVVHVAAAAIQEKNADNGRPGELHSKVKLLFGEAVLLDIQSIVQRELTYYQLTLKRNQELQLSPSGICQLQLMQPHRLICKKGPLGKYMNSEVLRCLVQGSSQSIQNISIQQPGPIIVSQKGGVFISTIGVAPRQAQGQINGSKLQQGAPPVQQQGCGPSHQSGYGGVMSMTPRGQGPVRLLVPPSRGQLVTGQPLQRFPCPPQANSNLSLRELIQFPGPLTSAPQTRPAGISNGTIPNLAFNPNPGPSRFNYPQQTMTMSTNGTGTPTGVVPNGPRFNWSNGINPGNPPNYYKPMTMPSNNMVGMTAGLTGFPNAPKCPGENVCWGQMK